VTGLRRLWTYVSNLAGGTPNMSVPEGNFRKMVQLYRRKGGETLVNTQTSSDQSAADVAVLQGGGYVVVWADSSQVGGDSSSFGIKGQRFDANGNAVGGEFLVNTTTAGGQVGPTVAGLPSGRFVVTWSDPSATGGDTSGFAVRGQLFEANGTPVGGEFLINTATSGGQSSSFVAGLAGGGFAVTWTDAQGDGDGTGIKGQIFDSSGTKVGGEIQVNTSAAGSQSSSSVVGLPSGGFAAAWISTAFVNSAFVGSTMLQLFDSTGAKVGPEIQANAANGGGFSRANIAALADGFLVTWAQYNSEFDTDVRAQRFDLNGAKVGSEFVVHAALPGNQGVPDAYALPGGGFIITWQGPGEGASAYNVFGQIFDAAGARVGIEFVVSSVVSNDQLSPEVAVMPSGDIVVAWSDASRTGADFSGFAVKTQILTAATGPSTDIEISDRVLETAIENLPAATLAANGAVNSSYTYELLDDAGGAFRIEGNRLVVADNTLLDFETGPTKSITVRATDVNGVAFTEVVTVEIADVIREKRFSAEPEFQVNADQSQWESSPVVVRLATGGFAIIFQRQGDVPEAVSNVVRFFDSAGAPTSGEILLATGAWDDFEVAPLANGGFLTVRDQADSNGILVQAWNSAGQPAGSESVLGAIPMQPPSSPDVIQLSSGGYLVSWAVANGGISGQRLDGNGAPTGGTLTLANSMAQPPYGLEATPGGGFVAVWRVGPAEPGSTTYRLQTQFFDASGVPTGTAVFTDLGSPNIYDLDVIALSTGGYVVGWREATGQPAPSGTETFVVKAQAIAANGSAVGAPAVLGGSFAAFESTGEAAFKAHPSGGFVATWPVADQNDYFTQHLYGHLFDSTGNRVGSPFESIGDAAAASIAVLADGTFVASYREDDSHGTGVSARLYRPTDNPPVPDNNGDNTLIGDANANLLDGGAGNDHIHGNGGNDDLRGGSGIDRLYVSGTGIAAADGGADFDYLAVNYGDSTTAITMEHPTVDPNGGLMGSIGDGGARRVDYRSINVLQITTGSGNDTLHGGQSGSTASLGGGDDRYYGSTDSGGQETADGGLGVDGVSAGLGLATASIVWNLQSNSFSSPIGSFTNFEYFLGILTGSANDTVVTTHAALNDSVSLGAGDDTLTVANGQDHASGEFGSDLLIIDYSGSTNAIGTTGGAGGITLGSDSSGVSGQIGDGGSRRVDFFNFDRFDVRTGSGNDNIVLGTGSLVTNDIVSLGSGDDAVDFGRGIDRGDGGAGVDSLAADLSLAAAHIRFDLTRNSYSGAAGTSFVNFEHFGGTGLQTGGGTDEIITSALALSDVLRLGAGMDSATVYNGHDNVDGQGGHDFLRIDYRASTVSISTLSSIGASSGGSGVSGGIGNGVRSVVFNEIEQFEIYTGSGNDGILFGTGGLVTDDFANLGGGNDSVDFGRGVDQGDGGTGVDSLAADLSLATAAISINLVANSFSGPANVSFVNFEYFGGSGFRTGQGADTVVTGLLARDDTVLLGAGNDSVTVHNGSDSVYGEGGTDLLVVNYSDSAADIVTSSGAAGITAGTGGSGVKGRIGDGGARGVSFDTMERFDVRTGSGNDNIVLGTGSLATSDMVSLGGGDDSVDFGRGIDVGDGGSGVDSLAADISLAGTAISINLVTNSFSGPAGMSFVNFDYFGGTGFRTGQGADTVVTGLLARGDVVLLGAGNDSATVHNGQDEVNGQAGSDLLVVDYSASAVAIETNGGASGIAAGSDGSGVRGRIGDGAGRRVDFDNIERFDVRTGSGNDHVALGTGALATNDIVDLGGGDDFADLGRGLDRGNGGAGTDGLAADYSLAGSAIGINLLLNSWSGPAGTSFTNFEYLGSPTSNFLTGSGNDTIVTGSAVMGDFVGLGAGNDSIAVYNGADSVNGQAGSDLLVIDYSSAAAAILTTGGAGGITLGGGGSGVRGRIGVEGGGPRSVLFDNIERFDVRTGSGNDNIVLGTGSLATSDVVSLGGGDDSVDFGRGIDVGDGGAGVDSLAADISLAGTAISINLVTNSFSGPAGISFVNFEYFGGSGFHTGQGADTVVTGLLARGDVVALGAGNDSVTLHNGVDTVYGGTIGAGAANSGFDTLVLDYGAATASVTNLAAIQTNGAGAFGQIGDGSTRSVTFQAIDRFLITTGVGADSIVTAGGNDEIRTGGGKDSIAAGRGDDLLDGGAGADSMTGGTGNDSYVVDDAGDTVAENAGEGNDTVRTSLAAYSLAGLAHVENLTGTSAAGQILTGNAASNSVNAGSGNDVLHLWVGGGNDNVDAGAGMDNIFFGATLTAADVVNGGAGVDTLVVQGPYGSLTLTAGITQIENISILGGNNTNFGEPGTNRYDYVLTTHDANFAAGVQARINASALLEGEDFTFDGSAETDASYVVYGGKGKDTLLGGLGNDIFFYAEERFASGDTVNGGAGYDGMFLRGNYTIDFNAPGYTGLFTNIENLTLTSATDERYARGGGTEFDYNLVLSDAIVNAGQELTISGALLLATETMILDASQETNGTLRLFGGKAADTLKGGALADLFHGNLGADTLAGGGGADVFRYQAVTESYSVARDHIVDFSPGTDRIELDRIDAKTGVTGDQAFTWIGSAAFTNQAGQLRAFQSGGQWIVQGDINGDGFADLVIALTLQGPTPLSAADFAL
jgi:Ca2+-binding RTX toxin-like protein